MVLPGQTVSFMRFAWPGRSDSAGWLRCGRRIVRATVAKHLETEIRDHVLAGSSILTDALESEVIDDGKPLKPGRKVRREEAPLESTAGGWIGVGHHSLWQ